MWYLRPSHSIIVTKRRNWYLRPSHSTIVTRRRNWHVRVSSHSTIVTKRQYWYLCVSSHSTIITKRRTWYLCVSSHSTIVTKRRNWYLCVCCLTLPVSPGDGSGIYVCPSYSTIITKRRNWYLHVSVSLYHCHQVMVGNINVVVGYLRYEEDNTGTSIRYRKVSKSLKYFNNTIIFFCGW